MPTTKHQGIRIPVYDVRLVKARRPLMLREDTIADASRAALALHGLISLTDREHLAVLFVNGNHRITGAHVAAMGGQHGINVDARPVLRAGLLACASAMIVGHNHPSGDPSPSAEDISFTARLIECARVIGVPVVDHVIVTRDERVYHSMLTCGTLPTA